MAKYTCTENVIMRGVGLKAGQALPQRFEEDPEICTSLQAQGLIRLTQMPKPKPKPQPKPKKAVFSEETS